MSIEFFPFDVDRCSLASLQSPAVSAGSSRTGAADAEAPRTTSPARLAANRRNARKSTGPRTPEGKLRVSRNALKHGLCADTAIPPCEDLPTFAIFLQELREEYQPHTVMQKILFAQIANVIWRMRRLPEAQAHIFEQELDKAADGEALSASQLLARRFSDDSSNGFILLGRYERTLQNALLRLMRQYEQLKKHRPYTPYPDDDDGRVQPEGKKPAYPSDEQMRVQKETFARRKIELPLHVPPRNPYEAGVDLSIWRMAEQKREIEEAKQTQSKPPKNAVSEPKTQRFPDLPPAQVTERTHRGKESQ